METNNRYFVVFYIGQKYNQSSQINGEIYFMTHDDKFFSSRELISYLTSNQNLSSCMITNFFEFKTEEDYLKYKQ